MKIVFSISFYTPYVSGLTIYVRRLAEELAKHNHEVSVLTNKYDQTLPDNENISGIEVRRAKPRWKISRGFISDDWIVKCWQAAKANDVVILNLPQLEAIVLAVFAAWHRKKIISIYHAQVFLRTGIINHLIQELLNFSNILSMTLSDRIVCYTPEYAAFSPIAKRFLSKTSYVYPIIPLLTPTRPKSKSSALRIGIAARLAEDKGFEYLFKAIPIIKTLAKTSVKIFVAGPMDPIGESLYKEKILRLSQEYSRDIVFLGEMVESDMANFYQNIDVLAVPSIVESFGIVQVEAMTLGIPVVCSNLPGANVPILKTGMGKLVEPRNIHQLAKSLVEVASQKRKFAKHKLIARKEFDTEKTIEKFQEVLSNLRNATS